MNLLFYMVRPGEKGEELLRSLPVSVPGVGLEAVFDLESFSERIRRRRDPDSIAIIWNPSLEDLRALGTMKSTLRQGRTLLALADQEAETIALAHNLLPAFIAYVEDGHEEILSVLGKLVRAKGRGAGPGGAS
jgi:hypothetical protein